MPPADRDINSTHCHLRAVFDWAIQDLNLSRMIVSRLFPVVYKSQFPSFPTPFPTVPERYRSVSCDALRSSARSGGRSAKTTLIRSVSILAAWFSSMSSAMMASASRMRFGRFGLGGNGFGMFRPSLARSASGFASKRRHQTVESTPTTHVGIAELVTLADCPISIERTFMNSNRLTMPCRRLWMVLNAALFLIHSGACSKLESPYNQVDIQAAGQLQTGASVIEVQSTLRSKGGFAFLTRTERGEQLGIEYRVGSWYAPMLFIFEDDALKSVVPVPRRETAVRLRENRSPESVVIPWNPNTVLKEILHDESYLGQQLIDYAEEKKPSGKPHIPNNLIPLIVAGVICPGLIVVGIAEELDRPRVLKDREMARRQWGYQRIGLGMEQREVELVFGEPRLEQTAGRVRGCVYGDQRRGTEIAVEFYDGRVRSMFGPQFRRFDWTGELRKAVLDSCQPQNP